MIAIYGNENPEFDGITKAVRSLFEFNVQEQETGGLKVYYRLKHHAMEAHPTSYSSEYTEDEAIDDLCRTSLIKVARINGYTFYKKVE